MDINSFLTIIISSLLSGLVGVLITICHYERQEKRKIKLQVLQQLLGNRHDLTGQEFTEALNQILVTFYDAPKVLYALKNLHEAAANFSTPPDLMNQRMVELIKEICRHLNINIEPLTDQFFLQAFNIKKKG
jgi:hypothetical protein